MQIFLTKAKKLFISIGLITIGIFSSPTCFSDPLSANYRLRWSTVDSGAVSASSTSYKMVASISQSSVQGVSDSQHYIVNSGFHTIPDTDEDSVKDFLDNCVLVSNADQTNSNSSEDLYGNACDADFDETEFVNIDDLDYFKSVFFTADAEADLDGNGFVNIDDLDLFKSFFFKTPGPSGLPTP